jgi:hypothetical protein
MSRCQSDLNHDTSWNESLPSAQNKTQNTSLGHLDWQLWNRQSEEALALQIHTHLDRQREHERESEPTSGLAL